MTTVLIIESRTDRGREPVGKISFGDEAPQLQLLSDGPAAEQLETAWQELCEASTLPMQTSAPTDGSDGPPGLATKRVRADSEDYKWAVWHALELRHGFAVRLKR